jgi:hypothetical protein
MAQPTTLTQELRVPLAMFRRFERTFSPKDAFLGRQLHFGRLTFATIINPDLVVDTVFTDVQPVFHDDTFGPRVRFQNHQMINFGDHEQAISALWDHLVQI